jgi:hypothetical protein
MTPIVELTPHGGKIDVAGARSRVKAVRDAVGTHPLYLDVKGISPAKPTETSDGKMALLDVVFGAAHARGLRAMPVAHTNGSDAELQVVRDLAARDGQGLALRHRMSKVSPAGKSLATLVSEVLGKLEIETGDVDLVLDLEYLDPDTIVRPRGVIRSVKQVAGLGEFRSIVLAATVVPPSFGGGIVPPNSLRSLPRREWELWESVSSAVDFPLIFGDYGVQNPAPPPTGPVPAGPWANVRYTTDTELVVARGADVRTTGNEQYVELCRWITRVPEFSGEDFSYGDGEIARWSRMSQRTLWDDIDDEGEDGTQSYWRGIGTAHHLARVSQQLQKRS